MYSHSIKKNKILKTKRLSRTNNVTTILPTSLHCNIYTQKDVDLGVDLSPISTKFIVNKKHIIKYYGYTRHTSTYISTYTLCYDPFFIWHLNIPECRLRVSNDISKVFDIIHLKYGIYIISDISLIIAEYIVGKSGEEMIDGLIFSPYFTNNNKKMDDIIIPKSFEKTKDYMKMIKYL
jgi:hypothetical protein